MVVRHGRPWLCHHGSNNATHLEFCIVLRAFIVEVNSRQRVPHHWGFVPLLLITLLAWLLLALSSHYHSSSYLVSCLLDVRFFAEVIPAATNKLVVVRLHHHRCVSDYPLSYAYTLIYPVYKMVITYIPLCYILVYKVYRFHIGT
jgi:hypothetical protein